MSTGRTYADVVEGVRATLAAYTHALDDGRTDDVVATFWPDGAFEAPGLGPYEGHDALRAAYGELGSRGGPSATSWSTPTSTHWDDHEATATSDVIFLLLGDGGWAVQLVGRYRDHLRYDQDGGAWRFHRRMAQFVTEHTPGGGTP